MSTKHTFQATMDKTCLLTSGNITVYITNPNVLRFQEYLMYVLINIRTHLAQYVSELLLL